MLQLELPSQYGLGLMLLLSTVVLRVGSNFLMSTIFSQPNFSRPFLVSLINSAFFIFVFGGEIVVRVALGRCFPALLHDERRQHRSEQRRMSQDDEETHNGIQDDDLPSDNCVTPNSSDSLTPDDEHSPLLSTIRTQSASEEYETEEQVIPLSQTAKIGAQVSPLWFLCNYLLALALANTTVSSVTIILATGSAWVLLLTTLLNPSSSLSTPLPLLSVILAILGVCIVSTHPILPTTAHPTPHAHVHEPEISPPDLHGKNVLLGDVSAVLASVIHAVYTVLLSGKLRGKRVTFPAALFACVGAANLVVFGPVWGVLGRVEWGEEVGLPRGVESDVGVVICVMIAINAAVSAFVDILWVSGMVKTSPLVATIGVKLTIPLALVVQVTWLKMRPDAWYWAGTACVCTAFGLMVWKKS